MQSSEDNLRAELAQTQVQLHQLMTAVQRQISAFDSALRSLEATMAQLVESDALPDHFADKHRAELVSLRSTVASTGTFLHWRLRGGAPKTPLAG